MGVYSTFKVLGIILLIILLSLSFMEKAQLICTGSRHQPEGKTYKKYFVTLLASIVDLRSAVLRGGMMIIGTARHQFLTEYQQRGEATSSLC